MPEIIKQWRPKIVHISCEWRYSDTDKIYQEAAGSGLIYKESSSDFFILTNNHVLTINNKYTPKFCDITFPGIEQKLRIVDDGPKLSFRHSKAGFDYGLIVVYYPNDYINQFSEYFSRCSGEPDLGDKIIILGYPGIGSQTDITVTEGIISGYDGDYYITSAKIEHGNSGGAAILLKDNCYLGIPTYTVTGEVESLARILKGDKVGY